MTSVCRCAEVYARAAAASHGPCSALAESRLPDGRTGRDILIPLQSGPSSRDRPPLRHAHLSSPPSTRRVRSTRLVGESRRRWRASCIEDMTRRTCESNTQTAAPAAAESLIPTSASPRSTMASWLVHLQACGRLTPVWASSGTWGARPERSALGPFDVRSTLVRCRARTEVGTAFFGSETRDYFTRSDVEIQ